MYNKKRYNNKFNNKQKYQGYSVKMSNMPQDITFSEMKHLISEWGQIIKININKNYEDEKIVYVDFKFRNERDYFIKALNKTKFDNFIINVDKC